MRMHAGGPLREDGDPHAKIPQLHVSEVKISVALVYTSICYTTMLAVRTGPQSAFSHASYVLSMIHSSLHRNLWLKDTLFPIK